jgi:Gpi18-like mannosyltransferase
MLNVLTVFFFYSTSAYSIIFIRPCMKETTKARIEIGLVFLLFIFIMPTRNMVFDFEFWRDWALQIHRHGLASIYDHPTTDYHPFYFYILWMYDKLQGTEANIIANLNQLKYFTLFFDFLPIVVLTCFRQRLVSEKIPYLYLLLNIAYLFNTMAWGQVDAIHTNLLFLAVVVAFYYPIGSSILFALALAMKPQAIIFIPILGIIWLYSVRNIATWAGMAFSICATLAVVALPFIIGGSFDKIWHVVTGAVGRYPLVSVCAFNIWYLITGINPEHTPDSNTYILLSYRHWGLLLFFTSSACILLPLLFRILRSKAAKIIPSADIQQMTMLASGLITLCFFYFNTQMHERYAHAIIIFFFFYGVYSKNYKLYILASIPYLLSLDKCFPDYLPVYHYKIIWASKVIAIWYTSTLVYAGYEYFRQYNVKTEWNLLKRSRQTSHL